MTDELPPLWASVDYPVLREAARHLEIDHVNQVNPQAVADRLNLTGKEVDRALLRLSDVEYVFGVDSSTLAGRDVLVTRMTAKGRREVGMWPSSKDGAALIEAIENATASTEDEDKKGFLREMARSGRNVGEGTLASIAAAVVSRMTTGF